MFPGNGQLPFSAATKADGLIYVSGTLMAKGDIKQQTMGVLDSIGATLKAAGSSLPNVVAATVYLKDPADAAAMTEVWRQVWPKDAPTRTTISAALVSADALIEIAVIAVPNGGERTVITPAGWSTANPYSYAIRTGDTLFMSGLVSRGAKDNQPVDGDVTTQMNTIFANAEELLKAAGFTMADVVANRVYLTDVAAFQEMNKAYVPHFPKNPPARATVIVGLPGPTYKAEVTMTAVRGAKEAITTPGPDGSPGKPSQTLSSAIKVGKRLYVSGILGNNADNKGNAEAQTKEAMARIERTLKAAGFEWTDVVDGVVYITDIANFQAMNNAYRPALVKDFPARATVRTGLVGGEGLVEIMFVASK
ncbi:MAG TPA: RidA family protein [Vicinamibacterales bacterium]|nr:RidA family protein [Vicinamibacterales bacterium]